MNQQRFAGKKVVVVGGNGGIGLAAAQAFANEGAQVLVTGRDVDRLRSALHEIGPAASAQRCDVQDLRQVADFFSWVRKESGHIDVLFVNAGVLCIRPIEAVTEADWDAVQDTNLKGAFFSVQAALPLMRKGSSIILTGSTAGRKAVATAVVYGASKAGLRALGRSMAAELIDRGIRVNVVSPGPTDTAIFARAEGLCAGDVPALLREQTDCVPMKRMGTPEEVAAAVLFLASDAAAFITGIDLLVDGGAASF